jgi:hypothetical protein
MHPAKVVIHYVRNLHDAHGSLVDALKKALPQLEEIHTKETEKIRLNPVQPEQLDSIDELLKRLGNPVN